VASYLFMRVDFPSGTSLGPSRTAILEGIDRFGSISASARAVGLTYRQVWSTVKLLNGIFPRPLVEVRVGGRLSGASLTPFGKQLVAHFRAMERDANVALKGHFEAFEKLLGEDAKAPAPVPRWAQVLEDAGDPPKSGPATPRARKK
jgi:molybdate transport system regulatory protein